MSQLNNALHRSMHIHGIEGEVIMTIAPEGLSFRVKGTKKSVTSDWGHVVAACYTPTDVPSYLMGKPYEFLQHSAKKVAERKEKRAAKGEK